ncbi:MAG TPA: hypothetical protein VGY48_30855 [Vicinamibacterales bacterium]|nr:hypothetical protein [Vicinamibacterales bacterium]
MLLAGQSVWQRLPTVFQGAFLGGLVVLPLALLVSIVRAGLRRPQPDSLKRTLHECVALGTSAAIVLAGLQFPGARGDASLAPDNAKGLPALRTNLPPSSSEAQSNTSNADAEQLNGQLAQEFRAIDAFSAAVPAETYDEQAALGQIGTDPVAIFHWIRDHTSLVPYRGALRGPVGVLMDRKGNSLDRALLLADLLHRAGGEVRLAHGDLSDAEGRQLLSRVRSVPPESTVDTQLAPWSEALLQQYAREFPADGPRLRQLADKAAERSNRLAQEVRKRALEQGQTIAAAVSLQDAGRASAAAPEVSDSDALRDHWWVQWHRGSDWTDLDPSLAESEPGRSFTTPQLTIVPDKLDSTLYHEVQIQVVTERWKQGQLELTPVLTQLLRPSELIGVNVSLVHIPVPLPTDVHVFQEADALGHVKAVAFEQHEWLPVLRVGTSLTAQYSFTDAGIVSRSGPVGRLGSTTARGLAGALGAFEQGAASPTPAVLTAEWIQYEIRSPGRPVRTIRRQLFDLVGPAARAMRTMPEVRLTESWRHQIALTLLGQSDILLLNCQLSREFVAHLLAQAMQANRQPLFDLVRATNPQRRDDAAAQIVQLPTALFGLAVARSNWGRHGDQSYIDRPNILSAHELFREDQEGSLVGAYGFDIVANEMGVLPGSTSDKKLIRLEQGVMDTNVEAFLASDLSNRQPNGTRPANISDAYRPSDNRGNEWLTVRSVEEAAWQGVQLGADVRSRIGQDLAAGYVVLTPSHPIVVAGRLVTGWWRIDLTTGELLGIGEQGWGQALPEWAMILEAGMKGLVIGAHGGFCLHAVGHHSTGAPQVAGVGLCMMTSFMAAGWFGGGELGLLTAELIQAATETAALSSPGGHVPSHEP